MKKLIQILVILLISTNISAQLSPSIPTSNTIANLNVADTRNWMAFSNPSNISYLKSSGFGFQYENRFLLNELSTKSVFANLPTNLVDMAFSASYFGYNQYNEILIGIGFARNFSEKFSLGVQFNYSATYFGPEIRYLGVLFPQLGLNLKLSPKFHLGFSTFNPFQQNINSDYSIKRLASVFSLGCEYFFADNFAFRSQIDKEISSNYKFGAGFDYTMLNFLTVKLGAYTHGYLVPCLGLTSNFGSFSFSYNADFHPLLGLVSIASVRYNIDKK